MHDSWKTLRSRIMDYLEKTTIQDLATALAEKRKALEKPRKAKKMAMAGSRKS